jgi:peptidoglycan/xylan/chitin deacetylase (PgdA/CDA1 family)
MRRFRTLVRTLLAHLLYHTGLLWLTVVVFLRNRAVVLTYHRVLPRDADTFSSTGIIVNPETFAAHMRFLRKHFNLLSVSRFQDFLSRGRFPPRSVLVTFDDGWHDLACHALPIMRRYSVPFVVFIPTAYIGTGTPFWQERMSRALVALKHIPEISGPLLSELGIAHLLYVSDGEARGLAREYVSRLKLRSTHQIEAVDAQIRTALSQAGQLLTLGDDVFLSWAAVREMAADPLVAVGSHGHTHVPLTRLSGEMAVADLYRAAEEFRKNGLPKPWVCAYPNGDCSDGVVVAAASAGCSVGFTTVNGHVRPGDDPLRLKRLNIHEGVTSSVPEFLCRILALY